MRITNIRFIILINLPIRFSCQYTIHTTIIILKNKITIIIKTSTTYPQKVPIGKPGLVIVGRSLKEPLIITSALMGCTPSPKLFTLFLNAEILAVTSKLQSFQLLR